MFSHRTTRNSQASMKITKSGWSTNGRCLAGLQGQGVRGGKPAKLGVVRAGPQIDHRAEGEFAAVAEARRSRPPGPPPLVFRRLVTLAFWPLWVFRPLSRFRPVLRHAFGRAEGVVAAGLEPRVWGLGAGP